MAAPSSVQSAAITYNGTPNNSKAFASNVTVGNVIIVVARLTGSSSVVPTITDNLSNTYTQVGTTQATPAGSDLSVFYAKVTTGGSCTVTYNGNGSNIRGMQVEVQNLNTSASPVDVSAQGQITPASASPSITLGSSTTVANSYLLGVIATDGGNTFTAGANYALLQANADVALQFEERIVSATGTYSAGFSITSATAAMFIVAFKGTGVTPSGMYKFFLDM